MRRHIVRPFRGVSKHRIAVRDLPRHEGLEIAHYAGIGILAKHQRRARMANKYMAQARSDTRITHDTLDLATDLVGSATRRRDAQFLLSYQGMYGSP